jgi:hypothetical protein
MDDANDRLRPARRSQAQHQQVRRERGRPGPGSAALHRIGQLAGDRERGQQHQRRLRDRRPGDARPAQPRREQQIEQDDAAHGDQPRRALELKRDKVRYLDAGGRDQPERGQADQQRSPISSPDFIAESPRRR